MFELSSHRILFEAGRINRSLVLNTVSTIPVLYSGCLLMSFDKPLKTYQPKHNQGQPDQKTLSRFRMIPTVKTDVQPQGVNHG